MVVEADRTVQRRGRCGERSGSADVVVARGAVVRIEPLQLGMPWVGGWRMRRGALPRAGRLGVGCASGSSAEREAPREGFWPCGVVVVSWLWRRLKRVFREKSGLVRSVFFLSFAGLAVTYSPAS